MLLYQDASVRFTLYGFFMLYLGKVPVPIVPSYVNGLPLLFILNICPFPVGILMKGQCFCSVQKKRMRGVRGKRLDPALKGLMGEANLRYTANRAG